MQPCTMANGGNKVKAACMKYYIHAGNFHAAASQNVRLQRDEHLVIVEMNGRIVLLPRLFFQQAQPFLQFFVMLLFCF